MEKISVGIVGGAGYTAGELLRLLIHHPQTEISFVHSKSNTGNPISDVHTDLLGDLELTFTDSLSYDIDVLFLCVGHGEAKVFWNENEVPAKVKVIDLSQDFRLDAEGNDFVYGLPELNKHKIKEANHIANPGCFATCLQLGVLPLAYAGWLKDDVHVNAITGSTGAGQKPSATSHFSWRNNNVSVYKAFEHQHLKEINQSIYGLQPDFDAKLMFLPMRGDFTRGIYASLYTKIEQPFEAIKTLYNTFYADAPFVHVSESNPHLKQIVNTNKGIIYLQQYEDTLLIISMIDNLLKGASGQAVHNMNLMFGLEETTGLALKASFF
ncbi:N-acetyl-gamma-glutamyl-phosphate reductase [Catalinimonas alkaloidigena]|uniref:N-acetyl-gamma-glutamyl-phosphate reductase n=1 Tax=Catalinimonas alkaloidigena TaxID=1075417 RepID=UPI0024065C0A|nr:N-acetyl-gamma-glutamyl-phosphate reductase [Catalinimonas alkaloidigena]MDF9797732.1 N-acetyl-gamma-glutamyl-phosphate reductase [Catalinimonas alkaloidigena]